MKYPRYPEYKDSGVTWLGQVPKHWETKPLKHLFHRTKRTGFSDEALLSVYRDFGVILKSSRNDNFNNPSEDLGTYQLVCPGDMTINKMKAWQGSVAISQHKGIVSPAYFVFEPKHNHSSRYLHYLIRSQHYIGGYLLGSKGIRPNQWDLDPDYHGLMPLVVPTQEEQTAIATFLNRETAKIDALIGEQEKLIALLAEKRQAVISHAVTKGLDPTAPMKDSGIAWLGKVPKHWNVKRIKFVISSIEQGWSPQCEGYPVETDDEWGVLKVGCVNTGAFNPKENKKLPDDLTPIPELSIKKDDLLISRANTRELVGSAATAETDYPNLLLCDKLYRLRMKSDKCQPLFMSYYLRSNIARGQIELSATGASSSMQNIGQASITELPIALPDIDEQSKIISRIIKNTASIDTLTTQAQRAIELLKEHRSALISACVTGKIDVRGCVEPSADVTEAA